MKYETPELTALTPAINAIQGVGPNKVFHIPGDNLTDSMEQSPAYADWE
jgi:hypothetical protein